MKKTFTSQDEFVNWLIANEGEVLGDGYGRRWQYKDGSFYYKDIGTFDEYEKGMQCAHLWGTNMYAVTSKEF